MKYVIVIEECTFESTSTDIIKVVSSKERAEELVEQLSKEQEETIKTKKLKIELQEKLNNRFRNEIEPNQYYYSNYRKQSTYEITKEVATKTLGYTKEMWKKYVEEQNKIIEENKVKEKEWQEKFKEEQKRIDKEREEIKNDFKSKLSKEELELFELPYICVNEGTYSYLEVPYEE